jgi:hypothetical protein
MLNEQSKANLESFFRRVATTGLVRDPTHTCVIATDESRRAGVQPGEKLVVITISSFTFRLLVIFHIGESPGMREYFGAQAGGQPLEEMFYEIGNMCCGALNTQMMRDFPHLAMSIPNSLGGACVEFLDELRPQYVSTHVVTLNETAQLRVTLCLCCSAPVTFSAAASVATATTATTGELELF